MQNTPNFTVGKSQRGGDIVRAVKRRCIRAAYARSVPNSSGPMKSGSCQVGKITASPVAGAKGDGEAAESGGSSTMI